MQTPTTFRYIETPEDQQHSFSLMRELRPHLDDALAYARQLNCQTQDGYRLLGAFEDDALLGLIGFRRMENLIYGRFIYVDDLIVDTPKRHQRLGAMLLQVAREQAQQQDCAHLVLDTGSHMSLAQRFYFREGLLARGMHFVQLLKTETESSYA
ncbi:MAG: family N-acetyltransferase [Pseudomonas sp.]|nr:family N-acetyltransferase [Pseudomonas sp.]